jgi:hypothetical protein
MPANHTACVQTSGLANMIQGIIDANTPMTLLAPTGARDTPPLQFCLCNMGRASFELPKRLFHHTSHHSTAHHHSKSCRFSLDPPVDAPPTCVADVAFSAALTMLRMTKQALLANVNLMSQVSTWICCHAAHLLLLQAAAASCLADLTS